MTDQSTEFEAWEWDIIRAQAKHKPKVYAPGEELNVRIARALLSERARADKAEAELARVRAAVSAAIKHADARGMDGWPIFRRLARAVKVEG